MRPRSRDPRRLTDVRDARHAAQTGRRIMALPSTVNSRFRTGGNGRRLNCSSCSIPTLWPAGARSGMPIDSSLREGQQAPRRRRSQRRWHRSRQACVRPLGAPLPVRSRLGWSQARCKAPDESLSSEQRPEPGLSAAGRQQPGQRPRRPQLPQWQPGSPPFQPMRPPTSGRKRHHSQIRPTTGCDSLIDRLPIPPVPKDKPVDSGARRFQMPP